MVRRIAGINPEMTWKEFKTQFFGFFPTSDTAEQESILRSEYKRLTGREPKDDEQNSTTDIQAKKPGYGKRNSRSDKAE